MTAEQTDTQAPGTTASRVAPRLKHRYREEILPALHEQFGYANVMQVPGLTKIVVNMGVGDRVQIMETRPLSATKRWRVVQIVEKAQ